MKLLCGGALLPLASNSRVPALNSNPSSQTTFCPGLLNSMAGAPSFSMSFVASMLPFHPLPSGTSFRPGVSVCALDEQAQQVRVMAATLTLRILIFMLFSFSLWFLVFSFVSQRHHRVHARGPARGQPAGEQRDEAEQQGCGKIGRPIGRLNVEQQCFHQLRDTQRAPETEHDAQPHQLAGLTQHQSKHVTRLRAEGMRMPISRVRFATLKAMTP